MERGWTLLEILVALAVVCLLAVAAIPTLEGARDRSSDGATKQSVRSMFSAVVGFPSPSLESMLRELPSASAFGDEDETRYELSRDSDSQITLCGVSDSGRVYCMRGLDREFAYSVGSTRTSARIALPTKDAGPVLVAGANSDRWIDSIGGEARYEEASEEREAEDPPDVGAWPDERTADSPSAVCRLASDVCEGELELVAGGRVDAAGIDTDPASAVPTTLEFGAGLRILPTREWTSEMWVRGSGRAVGLEGSWSVDADGRGLEATVVDENGTRRRFRAPAGLLDSVWYHVALVRDGSSARVYLNGRPAGGTSGLGAPSPALDRLVVGPFRGAVDEWAWYPRALPAARIMAHARAGCQCQPQDVREGLSGSGG